MMKKTVYVLGLTLAFQPLAALSGELNMFDSDQFCTHRAAVNLEESIQDRQQQVAFLKDELKKDFKRYANRKYFEHQDYFSRRKIKDAQKNCQGLKEYGHPIFGSSELEPYKNRLASGCFIDLSPNGDQTLECWDGRSKMVEWLPASTRENREKSCQN